MMYFTAESHADLLASPQGLDFSYEVKEVSTLKMKQYVRNANCWHVGAGNDGVVVEYDLDYGQVAALHERLGLQLAIMKPERRVQLRRADPLL